MSDDRTTPGECPCAIVYDSVGRSFIQYCPLHRAAPTLRDALMKALKIMNHLGDVLNAHDMAFDDPKLPEIEKDWEFCRVALRKAGVE